MTDTSKEAVERMARILDGPFYRVEGYAGPYIDESTLRDEHTEAAAMLRALLAERDAAVAEADKWRDQAMTDSNDMAALLHEAQIAGLGRPRTDLVNRLREALARVTAERDAAVAGRVKPLVWETMAVSGHMEDAQGFNSVYRVWTTPDGMVWWQTGYARDWLVASNVEAAKAAAQADYEARVLAALHAPEPAPAGDVVSRAAAIALSEIERRFMRNHVTPENMAPAAVLKMLRQMAAEAPSLPAPTCEPVAWADVCKCHGKVMRVSTIKYGDFTVPLYAHPAQEDRK